MVGNYFNLKEVSNSDLTALARAYNALPDNCAELEDVYNFGSLVDAMLTEDWRVDHYRGTLTQDDGTLLRYTPEIYEQAYRLAEGARKDPVIKLLIENSIGQYIFVRTLEFIYEADTYQMRCRCKFDAFNKVMQMGADYKTTACATLKSFRNAISFFHWDRQAAFYMDLARIDRHWIIGISKKNGEIFKQAIERGDPIYEAGKIKYSHWAYRYKLIVEGFAESLQAPTLITI